MRTTRDSNGRSFFFAAFLRSAWAVWFAWGFFAAALPAQTCAPLVLHGEVTAGQSYMRPISPSLDFKLEAVPTGWMMRVLPHGLSRPPHDYAELANPPYRSPTPLLISTDFGFRAQDAIAWNPRSFRYFSHERERAIAEAAYQAILAGKGRNEAGTQLLQIVPEADEAQLTLVDAELAGGSADQTAAASRVASHLAETGHRVRTDLPPSSLGKLLWLSFRVTFPTARCGRGR